jgi:acetyl/propionyl-CoA carboxylase alpha subunit
LRSFPILGLRTNVPFLIKLLEHPAVRSGQLHTRFIEDHAPELLTESETPIEAIAAAALAASHGSMNTRPRSQTVEPDPWETIRGWGR